MLLRLSEQTLSCQRLFFKLERKYDSLLECFQAHMRRAKLFVLFLTWVSWGRFLYNALGWSRECCASLSCFVNVSLSLSLSLPLALLKANFWDSLAITDAQYTSSDHAACTISLTAVLFHFLCSIFSLLPVAAQTLLYYLPSFLVWAIKFDVFLPKSVA